jgi:hypothetical protein
MAFFGFFLPTLGLSPALPCMYSMCMICYSYSSWSSSSGRSCLTGCRRVSQARGGCRLGPTVRANTPGAIHMNIFGVGAVVGFGVAALLDVGFASGACNAVHPNVCGVIALVRCGTG